MYEGAAKVRATITKQFNRSFKQEGSIHKDKIKNDIYNNDSLVDLMIIPTALTDPPFIGSEVNLPDPTEAFLNDLMTVPLSLAGIPSISIPIPRSRKSVHNIDSSSQSHDDIFYHRNDKSNGDEVSYIHPVIGMQIFGSKLTESKVLKAAHVLEHDLLKNQMDMQ
jgi:Asp-tRNA(Asn)/Glu-tRNA(Gln) amidotransferase A subunit family amidase